MAFKQIRRTEKEIYYPWHREDNKATVPYSHFLPPKLKFSDLNTNILGSFSLLLIHIILKVYVVWKLNAHYLLIVGLISINILTVVLFSISRSPQSFRHLAFSTPSFIIFDHEVRGLKTRLGYPIARTIGSSRRRQEKINISILIK